VLRYNSRVRGNTEEDIPLMELCHQLLSTSNQEFPKSTSGAVDSRSQMPLRLIKIDDNTSSWRLIDTGGRDFSYAVLSHVFGTSPDRIGITVFTKSFLQLYQSGCPINDMPLLFRDACHITRQLGIQYLWVDWLCTAQDDEEERQDEISDLYTTHRNCTIAILPSNARLQPTTPEEHLGSLHILNSDRHVDIKSYSVLDHKGHWKERAWVVQENIVSSRKLSQAELVYDAPALHHGKDFAKVTVSFVTDKNQRSDLTETNTPITYVNLTLEQWDAIVKSLAENEGDEEPKKGKNCEQKQKDVVEQPSDAPSTSSTVIKEDAKEDETATEDIDLGKNLMADVQTFHSNPQEGRDQLKQVLEFAESIAQEGIENYNTCKPLQAIAKLVKARDYLSAFSDPSVERLQGYLLFSTHLALVYLGQGILDVALDVLTDAEKLLKELTLVADNLSLTM